MALGPGKYDDVCTEIRERLNAVGIILIVIEGDQGTGFSCQGNAQTITRLPGTLEQVAMQMRQDQIELVKEMMLKTNN
jgi:hypothetical protein